MAMSQRQAYWRHFAMCLQLTVKLEMTTRREYFGTVFRSLLKDKGFIVWSSALDMSTKPYVVLTVLWTTVFVRFHASSFLEMKNNMYKIQRIEIYFYVASIHIYTLWSGEESPSRGVICCWSRRRKKTYVVDDASEGPMTRSHLTNLSVRFESCRYS